MSQSAENVEVTIKDMSDTIVGHGFTDISGNLDFPLAAGKYKVYIGDYAGYALEQTVFTEPNQSPITSVDNPVLDVDITEEGDTDMSINFLQY